MEISIFLAKLLGLYLTIVSIAMLIHAQKFRNLIPDLTTPAFNFLGGVMALLLGLLIVLSHNIWQADWRVLITLLGWMTLIKGVARLFIPNAANKLSVKYIENSAVYYVTVVILLIIGIYLSYVGFSQ